jgi:hypothetical protein
VVKSPANNSVAVVVTERSSLGPSLWLRLALRSGLPLAVAVCVHELFCAAVDVHEDSVQQVVRGPGVRGLRCGTESSRRRGVDRAVSGWPASRV